MPSAPRRTRPAARGVLVATRGALVAVLAAALLAGSGTAVAAPSPDEVAARAQASRLEAVAGSRQGEADAVRERLDELTAAASAALEANTLAEQAWAQSEADHWVATERLDYAEQDLRQRRGDLGRWAAQVYRDGGDLGAQQSLVALMQATSTDDLSQRLTIIKHVGRLRGADTAAAGDVEQTQVGAVERSRTTSEQSRDAARLAEQTKAEADRLATEQREQLAVLDALLAQSRDDAAVAAEHAENLTRARVIAEERAAAAQAAAAAEAAAQAAAAAQAGGSTSPGRPASGANRVTGAVGACAGEDVSVFPNGQIPASALCPLWGTSGGMLRADAAFAFDRMSQAYAAEFGRPVCVTDSYRTYESQVRLKASKPTLAAKPGTSNHGWGTALDLCDGINTFGSAQHQWMQRNAPAFGWFHPSWARQGGGKPEAWHWEFGG